ncbi:MAG: 30S ribosomal protein S6 [Patescibacteria group bacterium]|nr:30S ribosomal protein S6 [Patescibacteria group bacterium]
MPQYELMYILSSAVPDNEEPALTKQLTDFVTEANGEILKVENLGRKKLAYPIKRTRNGLYVLVQFKLAPEKVHELEHKIRVTAGIIRHLVINMEEDLIRQAKDLAEQKAIRRRPPKPRIKPEEKKAPLAPEALTEKAKTGKSSPKIEIDLDKQIEKALEEDLTK